MARKPNYNFEKRQKDLARIKKKEEKLQKKALKKEGVEGEGEGDPDEAGPQEVDPTGEIQAAE